MICHEGNQCKAMGIGKDEDGRRGTGVMSASTRHAMQTDGTGRQDIQGNI